MRTIRTTIAVALLAGLAAAALPAAAQDKAKKKLPDEVARGRYLVQITGCNDCHTPATRRATGRLTRSCG